MAITTAPDRQPPHSLLWALLASIALHSGVLGFVPGFSLLDAEHTDTPIIVELSPPIPLPPPAPEKPLPTPEKITPAPIKPKLQKPVIPPPVTMPAMQPAPPVQNNAAATPPTEAPKMAAEHIIALEAKPAEPPPAANTVATATQPTAPVTERNEEDTSAARNAYGALLAKEFAKHRKYPQLARMRGWQGTVKISLQIDTEGNAANPSVSESSGKQMLDEQALETVKKALPLPLPPEVLRGKGFSIVVPIVFRLENG